MAVQGFFSPDRKTRMAGERENDAAFSVKVEPVKLASNINQYNEQTPSLDYAPDRVGEYIKESETKSYIPKDDKPYFTSSGDYFTKDPDKGGSLIQRSGDDMRFSQSYDRDEKGQLTKNYQKEYAGFLKSGESSFGSFPETTVKQLAYREKPKLTLGTMLRGGTEGYIADPKKAGITKMLTRDEFDNYRRDLVKTAAEKSPYGADVEVGKKRFDESTGVMGYKYDFDKAKFVDTEKKDMIQYRDTPKGEGYFFKDFYKPGEFQTKEDLNRYLSDRGAYMTNMPSNFEGGISGRGEKTDDLSSMYRSTAGDEKTRLQKAKEEGENKNILQRVGDFVGDTFNKLTGTEAAGADTLQAQGINTSATTNIAQMGGVSDSVQRARDAVAKANLRASGLDRTVGGRSSQANYGSGRTGGFGTGTHGKGMPSNPGSQRQTGVGKSAGNLSRHKAGPSTSRGGISRSTSRGQGGGSSSRSRGGTGTGRSSQGSKSSARGARGSAGSRGRGGTGSGGTSTSRSASKASRSRTGRSRTRCDIRTKIDISPLINSNLVKDNLAEVAYFVQEIKK